MIKRVAILIVALVLSIVATFGVVQAQDDISASTVTEVQFPSAMTFHLSAQSTVDITEIFLRYKIDGISTIDVTSVVIPAFEQTADVETGWIWDMRKFSLPPGAEVQYSWRIRDASGDEIETSWTTVEFNDERYSWNSLTEEQVTLFWYYGEQAFAQELLDAALDALDVLAQDTGAFLDYPAEIYIYSSSRELQEATIYPQEWMGGVAFADYGIVAMGVDPGNLAWGKRAVAHELAHLVTAQMTSNPYNDIPTWLDEGLSLYAEGELRDDLAHSLDRAISEDQLISVQSISGNFPVDVEQARLSYAESYSLVEFLTDNYDKERMLLLLSIFEQGSSYDDALLEVYGFDTTGLDNAWRQSLGLEPRQTPSSPYATATPAPQGGLLDCQMYSQSTDFSAIAVFALLGMLLLPGIWEAVRFRAGKGIK